MPLSKFDLAARTRRQPPPTQHSEVISADGAAGAGLNRSSVHGGNLSHEAERRVPQEQPLPAQHGDVDNPVPGEASNKPSTRTLPATPTLEALPAELRNEILSHLTDLDDLRAVVRASPVLHQQYLLSRQRLLGRCLMGTLGNVLVDAYIHQGSSVIAEQRFAGPHRSSRSAMTAVMDDYGELRRPSQPACREDRVLERCGIDDLTNMASFYLAVVQPLVVDCATLFLQNLGVESPPELGLLRDTEKVRLLRALYRFQIYQDLFATDRTMSWYSDGGELGAFFSIFHPWELEEVHCIDHLVRAGYDRIFDDIKWDVHKTNARFGKRTNPMTPKGAFDLDERYSRQSFLDGTISRGLELFQAVLKVADHEALIRLMQQNMTRCLGEPIPEAMIWLNSEIQRHFHPSEHDQMEAARQKMPFFGDEENAPPLAWVIIWRGRYSNTYGDLIPSVLQDWGYVFWDVQRLTARGGEMKRQLWLAWWEKWPDRDPRDQ